MSPAGVQGTKVWALGGQKPGVDRVEPVHVLVGRNGHQHPRGIHLGRQGQLHQDAVDVVAGVEIGKQLEQLFGCAAGGRRNRLTVDADRFRTP